MTRKAPGWTGIQSHGAGWRAVVSQGRGRTPLLRQFPMSTPLAEMQAWRARMQAKHPVSRSPRAVRGTFAGDAARYLAAVAGMPTYKERKREIGLWVAVFGQRPRDRITAADIRTQRERWRTAPRSDTDARPLANGTINKRMRALSNLWTVLDGPRAPNPVREIPELQEATHPPRALDYETIERILALVSDKGYAEKGHKRTGKSKSRARLRVLAYTGWPLNVLARLTPADVDLKAHTARLPARQKGKGAPSVVVPLLPQAVDALRDLERVGGWGPFSKGSLYRAWVKAAKKAGVTGARPYDLRHSLLSAIALASQDEWALQTLAQHQSRSTTRRYTSGTIAPRLAAAIAAVSPTLPTKRR